MECLYTPRGFPPIASDSFLAHSKSRIKRIRGLSRPKFRLRVGEARVFYDVTEAVVEILAIVPKSQAATWLEQAGEADEGNSPF